MQLEELVWEERMAQESWSRQQLLANAPSLSSNKGSGISALPIPSQCPFSFSKLSQSNKHPKIIGFQKHASIMIWCLKNYKFTASKISSPVIE